MPSSSSSFAANNILPKKAGCRNQPVHCSDAPMLLQAHHQGFGQRRTELSEVPISATQTSFYSCFYIIPGNNFLLLHKTQSSQVPPFPAWCWHCRKRL